MAKENPSVKIVKDGDKVVQVEIMEQAIVDVATAARKLLNSKLTKRAILVLIRDSIIGNNIGLKDIEVVLDCASKLDKRYLK